MLHIIKINRRRSSARPGPKESKTSDKWGVTRRAPMSQIRKAIAVNMERSASTIPHVTNFDDADITELERIRKGAWPIMSTPA